MFALEASPAKAAQKSPRAFAIARIQAESPDTSPVLRRQICPCGGGCPRCAEQGDRIPKSATGEVHAVQSPVPNQRLAHPLQAKLMINTPGDQYEQEADRVADQVMRMPKPQVQRQCACGGTCAECSKKDEVEAEHGLVQMKHIGPSGVAHTEAPPIVHEVLRSPGQPLDAATRGFMEPRFGRDFSQVRVHTNASAADSAKAMGAEAYTAGSHVVFAASKYRTASEEGQKLLAHELTHTIQQGTAVQTIARSPENPTLKEREVAHLAHEVMENLDEDGDDKKLLADIIKADKLDFQAFEEILRATTRARYGNYFVFLMAEHKRFFAEEQSLPEAFSSKAKQVGGVNKRTVAAALFWKNNVGDWEKSRAGRSRLASALMQHDNAALHSIWAECNGDPGVFDEIDQIAVDWLTQQIKGLALSHSMPPDAYLVTKPKENLEIEIDHIKQLASPNANTVSLGHGFGSHGTATVGFEWGGKRIVSIKSETVNFEFVGHEGIYYQIGGDYFWKFGFAGAVATEVDQATKPLQSVGRFVKGFLTAIVSPGIMLAETAAQIFDIANLAISTLSGGRIGYLCLSSTCREFEECLKKDEDPNKCQDAAFREAMENATVIIPLYRQGRECLGGNEEACGAIAEMALGIAIERGGGYIKKRGRMLAKGEVQDAAIREVVDRARPEDPNIAEALEKPKPPKETAPHAAAGEAKPAARKTGHQTLDSVPAIGAKDDVVLTEEGIELCSPACPLLRQKYWRELSDDKSGYLRDVLDDLTERRLKAPKDAALRRESQFLEKRLAELKARNDLVDAIKEPALKQRARAVVDLGVGLDREQLRQFEKWIAESKSSDQLKARVRQLEEYVETSNVRRNTGSLKNVHPEVHADVEHLFSDPELNARADGHLKSLRLKVDVDEINAVGSKVDEHGNPISRDEAMRRALDPHNREFKDYKTNQRTKHMGTDVRDKARTAKTLKPVSLAKDPNVLFTRRFDEIIEVKKVFDQAKDRLPSDWKSLEPTQVKARVNRAFREIVKDGQTPEGIAVRRALAEIGYEWQPDVPLAAVTKGS